MSAMMSLTMRRTFVAGHRTLRPWARHFSESTVEKKEELTTREATVFVDSVFPVQISVLDIRRYIGNIREENLLASLRKKISELVKSHNFEIVSLEPHHKEGGVFVRFKYESSDKTDSAVLKELEQRLQASGALPSWTGMRGLGGGAWLVKGSPWKEDMRRFPSPILKVAFEGPDVHEQSLYDLFRPYGRIVDVTEPTPVPSGVLRSATVSFYRISSAAIAHNVLHGIYVPSGLSTSGDPSSPTTQKTRLRTSYESPIKGHVIRDWISKHPKTFLPVLLFLLGTLTYTVFDPVRSLMVKGKILDYFEFREFKLYKWLRTNALDRLYKPKQLQVTGIEVWKERKDAEAAVEAYLADLPTTVAFIHGPQGSGKTTMLQTALKAADRKSLTIDCRELMKVNSDSQVVTELARQTGYWPHFSFLNSMNTLVDLASVGLIGQKAGFSNSLTDQVEDILGVVGNALKGVSSAHRDLIKRDAEKRERRKRIEVEEDTRRQRIARGTWHDGRIDCVAGNGIMSELGFGDERLSDADGDAVVQLPEVEEEDYSLNEKSPNHTTDHKRKADKDLEAVEALPIVVIRNFATRSGSNRQDLLAVLAQWAAALAENQIAHVIVISDNRENVKLLAKALPTKPLNSIALSDADAASALAFVKQKLQDSDANLNFSSQQVSSIERLGGRASDLESLIHKVRSGQSVEDAVEDIINRGVTELRKNAFGDDAEDAKNLPWTSEQAWTVLKTLSKQAEIPYYDLLLEYPFKGDESPLKSMEHAELISIGTHNGRPSIIRPGKPVFRFVFERLANDRIFQATKDVSFNEKVIASAEATIKACEEELVTLKEITPDSWFATPTDARRRYLLGKVAASERKIERLEVTNTDLKRVLARGG